MTRIFTFTQKYIKQTLTHTHIIQISHTGTSYCRPITRYLTSYLSAIAGYRSTITSYCSPISRYLLAMHSAPLLNCVTHHNFTIHIQKRSTLYSYTSLYTYRKDPHYIVIYHNSGLPLETLYTNVKSTVCSKNILFVGQPWFLKTFHC